MRDINQIKGLPELEKLLDTYQEKDTLSTKEQSNLEEQELYKSKQAILFYNDSQVKVVIPKTEKASIFFGRGTKWCTAARNDNMFKQYNNEGPLYIVIIKGTNEKYQFHWKSNQFMDSSDSAINPNELATKYPILWDIFNKVAIENYSLILNKNPSEEVQLAAVKQR